MIHSHARQSSNTSNKRGMILIETLCALLVGLLTGAALLALMQITMSVRTTTMGPDGADAEAREQMDLLSNRLRNAQSMTVGAVKQVLTAAAARISPFTPIPAAILFDSGFQTLADVSAAVRRDYGGLRRIHNNCPRERSFSAAVYLLSAGVRYLQRHPPAGPPPANANAPVTAELPKIGALNINITVTVGGYSRQIYSLVRLRNSPLT